MSDPKKCGDNGFFQYSRIFEAEKHQESPRAMTWEKMDVEKYLRAIKDANADAINAYAKDCLGYTYYDTKVGVKLPTLKINLFEEITKLAPKIGLKVIAYFGTLDFLSVDNHPDWAMKTIDGKNVQWPGILPIYMSCYNSPYAQYMMDLLAEISDNYKIDALVADMYGSVGSGAQQWKSGVGGVGCYCEHCKKAYRDLFGCDIPTQPDWSDEWKQHVKWRMDYTEKLWEDMIAVLQKRIPGLPVYRNFWASPDTPWVANAQRIRFVKGEMTSSFESFGPYSGAGGRMGVVGRGLTGGKAGGFVAAPGLPIHNPGSLHALKLDLLNIMSHGGKIQCFSAIHYADGTMNSYFLKMLGEAFGEMAEKEVYIKGASSIPYAGILHSDSTRTYYGQEDPHNKYGLFFWGAIDQLMRAHVPFDIVGEHNITAENLARYSVIVMPNTAAMTQEQCQIIRDYVKNGGTILAAYETSLYDDMAHQLADFGLGDVFGLKYLGKSNDPDFVFSGRSGSYMVCGKHQITDGLPDTEFWMEGPYVKTEVTSGESIAYHTNRADAKYPKVEVYAMMPGEETKFPVIHLNNFGKGKAIFITNQFFNRTDQFHQVPPQNLPWLQKLVDQMIDWLGPNPSVRVEAPVTVEATFFENKEKKQIIVNLVNRTHIDVETSLKDIAVYADKKIEIKEAYSPWPKKRELVVSKDGGCSKVVIEELKTHEVVILQM